MSLEQRATKRGCLGCILAGIAVIAAAIGLGYWLLWSYFAAPFSGKEFDRAAWLADPPNRGPMLASLYDHLPMGMERAKVIALLGKPDVVLTGDTKRFYEEQSKRKWHRIEGYELGAWSGFRVDGDSLYLLYDSDDKLRDAFRVQG